MMRAWTGMAAAFLIAGGCNSSGGNEAADPATPRAPAEPRGATPTPAPRGGPANQPSANAAQSTDAAAAAAGPVVPAGARYTIYCDSISTPDHVARAMALRDALAKNARARDWYVIHQAGESSIYHGYYKEIDARKATDNAGKADAARAAADKKLVEALPNPAAADRKLFPASIFVPLDSPDPTAPAEWSLTNAPGYWSVQVAAFTGPERKGNALDAVRTARGMGITAYYYHGPSVSSVCVNSWPADALKRQSTAADEQLTRNEDEAIFVNLSGNELSPEERRALARDGKPIKEFRARVEILDPTLKATLAQYPEHAVDGDVQTIRKIDRKTGKEVLAARPSMIVPIPRQSAMDVARTGGGEDPALPAPPASGAGSESLRNRLRGIGQ